MLRYAISDRTLFSGDETARQSRVIRQAAILAQEGIDFFQIREKDLPAVALLALTNAVREAVEATGAPMRVVLNAPSHVAAGAGVAWHRSAGQPGQGPCFSSSVHMLDEVDRERSLASLLLFAPVFGKTVAGASVQPGVGLHHLQEAVQHAGETPVLALGGVTLRRAPLCMAAGAAGIAGIRLFLR